MNSNESYLVVARKYRPSNFSDLVGQSQVATALGNAIQQNRVGHAYLFTGARGVGKTSSARIFAKCLNCQQGPATEPCDECDVCLGIASGEDVDVLEIDGASNRGIEEIRQLRSNANVRPSRARYKIYIIDEVHMLTTQAFNALLKTLEEPPAHVKFIFCTTDPEKIPITVLSRCQRFDFPPILTDSIKDRLQQIVDAEGMEAEEAALDLLARRAGGSMRDSQSLLEQLLSFTTGCIREVDVHTLLGTADFGRVFAMAEAIVNRQTAQVLTEIASATADGVDSGQLTEQLLGLFRDLMARKVGSDHALMLHTSRDDLPRLDALCEQIDLETILAMLQILDQALVKMKQSNHVRTLLETAAVRLCQLENLDQIPKLLQQLQQGVSLPLKKNEIASPPPAAASSAPSAPPVSTPPASAPPASAPPAQPTPVSQPPAQPTPVASSPPVAEPPSPDVAAPPVEAPSEIKVQLDERNLPVIWKQVLAEQGDITSEIAANYERLEISGTNQILVTLKTSYDCQICCRADRKSRLEQAVSASTGQIVRIDFQVSKQGQTQQAPKAAPLTKRQRIRQLEQDEFIKKAVELFDAEIVDVKPAAAGKS